MTCYRCSRAAALRTCRMCLRPVCDAHSLRARFGRSNTAERMCRLDCEAPKGVELKPTLRARPRERHEYKCGVCGRAGHNRQRCMP